MNGGSKIRNLLDVALKGFVEKGAIVWTGSGTAISKTISCAEILKRKHKAHQITKISYKKYVVAFVAPTIFNLIEPC